MRYLSFTYPHFMGGSNSAAGSLASLLPQFKAATAFGRGDIRVNYGECGEGTE